MLADTGPIIESPRVRKDREYLVNPILSEVRGSGPEFMVRLRYCGTNRTLIREAKRVFIGPFPDAASLRSAVTAMRELREAGMSYVDLLALAERAGGTVTRGK